MSPIPSCPAQNIPSVPLSCCPLSRCPAVPLSPVPLSLSRCPAHHVAPVISRVLEVIQAAPEAWLKAGILVKAGLLPAQNKRDESKWHGCQHEPARQRWKSTIPACLGLQSVCSSGHTGLRQIGTTQPFGHIIKQLAWLPEQPECIKQHRLALDGSVHLTATAQPDATTVVRRQQQHHDITAAPQTEQQQLQFSSVQSTTAEQAAVGVPALALACNMKHGNTEDGNSSHGSVAQHVVCLPKNSLRSLSNCN